MKKIINKLLPSQQVIKSHLGDSRYAKSILESGCFHVTHRSVSRAISIGLFFAFIPIPLQMLLAATTAIYFRANFIIAIMMTWVTNPITFVPFNYIIFNVGHFVTANNEVFHDIPQIALETLNLSSIVNIYGAWIKQAGISFLIGIPIVAILAAVFGYIFSEFVWHTYLYAKMIKRKRKR